MSDTLVTSLPGKTIGIQNDQSQFSELEIKRLNGTIESVVLNLETKETDFIMLPGLMKSPTGQTSIGSFLFVANSIDLEALKSSMGFYVLDSQKHHPDACFLVGKELMMKIPIKVQMKALLSMIENAQYELTKEQSGKKATPHLMRFKKALDKASIGIPADHLVDGITADVSSFPNALAQVIDLKERGSGISNYEYLLLAVSLPYEIGDVSYIVILNTKTGDCYTEALPSNFLKKNKLESDKLILIGNALNKDTKAASLIE